MTRAAEEGAGQAAGGHQPERGGQDLLLGQHGADAGDQQHPDEGSGGDGPEEEPEPPGGGVLAPEAEGEEEGEEAHQGLEHRHGHQGQDHLGGGDGTEDGQVQLVTGPLVDGAFRAVEDRLRHRGRPGQVDRAAVHPRASALPPGGATSDRESGTGHHRAQEHHHVEVEDPGRSAQLQGGHRREGEHEPGQRGQQAQPGVEAGQVGRVPEGALAGGPVPVLGGDAVGRGGRRGVVGSGRQGRSRPSPAPGRLHRPRPRPRPRAVPQQAHGRHLRYQGTFGDQVDLREHQHGEGQWEEQQGVDVGGQKGAEHRPPQGRGHHHHPAGAPAPVDHRTQQRGHHREGRHGQQQVEQHLVLGGLRRDGEEQRPGQGHREHGVAGGHQDVGEGQPAEGASLVEQVVDGRADQPSELLAPFPYSHSGMVGGRDPGTSMQTSSDHRLGSSTCRSPPMS